jgi:hypothetical protein
MHARTNERVFHMSARLGLKALTTVACAALLGSMSMAPATAAPFGLPDTGSSGSSSTDPIQYPWDPDPRLWIEFRSGNSCSYAYFEFSKTELCSWRVQYADAGNDVNQSFSKVLGTVTFQGTFVRLRTDAGAYVEGSMIDVPGLAKGAPGEVKFDFEAMYDTTIRATRYAFREQGEDHGQWPI